MKLKTALLVTGAASTIGLSSMVGVVSAQSNTATLNEDGTSLVDKISQKFNLKKADVQAVFDEDKQVHQTEHQNRIKEHLDMAVSEGKITSAQETLILAKLQELKTTKGTLDDKTPEERKTLMTQKITELQQWAKDNNIPTGYLPMLHDGPALVQKGLDYPAN